MGNKPLSVAQMNRFLYFIPIILLVSPSECYSRRDHSEDFLSRRVPCTADCDIRLYSHCTQECKCDYDFPRVQRFCNPPPLPMFLNTCRLWYNGCPKFDQYHYASQFIYSKAEKGKTVGGLAKPIVDSEWAQRTGFVIPPDIPSGK